MKIINGNKKLLAVFALFSILLSPTPARAGAACFGACAIACCSTAGGPAAFAGPLGIAVGLTGCTGICMVACATAAFIPPACFADETKISVLEQGIRIEKDVKDIIVGDLVSTLKNEKLSLTSVLRNQKTQGRFEFVQITFEDLQNGMPKRILVTPEHGLVLSNENNELTIDSAEHINAGDRMLSADGIALLVTDIAIVTKNEKYTLETVDGTVLASDLFVTTMCNEEVIGGERLFEPTMKNWRMKHNFSEAH
ncbi:MAG: hypothetical protein I8H75_05815 [Myxococcaceae bacterium]|nr:hypothetical protein [Myxococcaceae bacterium]